jgi:hypothetical protein
MLRFIACIAAVLMASTPLSAQSIVFWGDSQTACSVGTGASGALSGCWAALASYDEELPGTMLAASGATAASQAAAVYGVTPNSSDTYRYMIGTNDQRLSGGSANKRANYAAHMACLVGWSALDAKKTRTDPSWSFTGSGWTNSGVYGIGKRSASTGDKATFSFTGTAVRICGIAQNSQNGVASVKVDGNVVGSWSFTGVGGASIESPGYAPTVFDVAGLSAGSHTVEIEHTSGSYVYLDWWASDAPSRSIIVGNTPRMTAAGYATYGGSDANVALFNADLLTVVETLNDVFGATIKIADVNAAVVPASDLLSDGIHLDQSGHWATAHAFHDAVLP